MGNSADRLSFIAEPISLDDLMYQADLRFHNGLFSEAEQFYRNILVKNPENHKASLGIALAALQQNKMVEAIQFMPSYFQ